MEIGVWGDSIAYGEYDSEALGWVGRIRKSLPIDARVYNRGVCGEITNEVLERFSVEAASIQPRVILFAIGINDSAFRLGEKVSKVPLDQYRVNMRELLAQALLYTQNIFLIGLTRVFEERISKTGTRFINSVIEEYDNVLEDLSKEMRIKYVKVSNVLDIDVDLADGLHPNAQGYEKMAGIILKAIQ